MSILLQIIALLIFIFMMISAIVSFKEKEPLATKSFLFLSILLPLPYLFLAFIAFDFQYELSIALLVITALVLIIGLIPFGRNKAYRQVTPVKRIDERGTMFSRNELKPGSENFIDYYKRNPDKKPIDDSWRKKPGLMHSDSSQYDPFQFASAEAGFGTIEALREEVNGPVNANKTEVKSEAITNYIKNWSKKLGALDCGITELQDYHLYSVGGRGERYGKNYKKQHQFAIAFTVEMDKEMVSAAPQGSIVMESGQQYLESGKIAIQLGKFIRKLGYEARAHVDGNYEVVCPLVACDAGLGEIGRIGILMTPKLGPRVRIAVVTTNLPLITDQPLHDYSMIDFCIKCKKCADSCPSQAISFTDRENIDGAIRWQINQEACFGLWASLGTDCGRCISVCPFSHPDNFLHNMVRAGIKNSSVFRVAALKLDDVFYGRKPAIAKMPEWVIV
jgi:reductive dehalogenase